MQVDQALPARRRTSERPRTPCDSKGGAVKKALIIEDDAVIRANILDLLDAEGYETLAAPNGRVGLELAMEKRPDLIICDIRMPEVSGFDVLKGIRASPETRAIPFIFLSAAADRADVRQ